MLETQLNCSRETKAFWIKEEMGQPRGFLETEVVDTKGKTLIRSDFSGISPGTERLVGKGGVPKPSWEAMKCHHMGGRFSFPLKYGYSVVGRVIEGKQKGQRVFLMHPHQQLIAAGEKELILLPEPLPSRRCILIPGIETALTAVWDSEVRMGERVLIVGGGLIGVLISILLNKISGVQVELLETNATKRQLLRSRGIPVKVVSQLSATDRDLAFHTSASGEGLQSAIDSVGIEGRIMDLSWYGDRKVTLDLGRDFHHFRKRIISSQVSRIPAGMTPRWDRQRRYDFVLKLISDPVFDQVITHDIPFEELPEFMEKLYSDRVDCLAVVVSYGEQICTQ